MTLDEAEQALEDAGLESVSDGAGDAVIDQLPAAGARIQAGSLVMLYVDNRTSVEDNGRVQVPDVTGLSVLEANRLLRAYGLEMRVSGGGIAVSQQPAAGEEVYPTAEIVVTFEPP